MGPQGPPASWPLCLELGGGGPGMAALPELCIQVGGRE